MGRVAQGRAAFGQREGALGVSGPLCGAELVSPTGCVACTQPAGHYPSSYHRAELAAGGYAVWMDEALGATRTAFEAGET